MNATQVKAAVVEYEKLKSGLKALTEGFGFEKLTIKVKLRTGEEWELAELQVGEGYFRGIGNIETAENAPKRWFSVHFDPELIAWIEFETFPI